MTITDAIALEHATLSRVFDEVEGVLPKARSAAEVRRLATVVEGLLRRHAELEVNFAFVMLDHTLYQEGRLRRLHEDHRELDERLGQVQEARTCERARGLLQAAMREARAHFRDEERNLLPVVEGALGLGVLSALGEGFKKKAGKAKGTGARPAGVGR